jgi:low temperature requirement protein LtrA
MAGARFRREHVDREQRATFLELFFDLVFVFAVTQLSHYLLRHLTVEGAAQTLLLLLVVWWAWIYTTWMTNWFDPDSVPVRLTLLAGMFASLAMAIAIPRAFGSRTLPFAAGYVGLQVARNVFIVAATKPESPLHVGFRRILAWSAWTGAIWITGARVGGETGTVIWVSALVADYAGPFAGYWTPGLGRTAPTDWELEHAHFAERFQLFIMIALGESIVIIGSTASGQNLTTDRWLAIALGFMLSAALWWLYFDEVAGRSAQDFKAAADERGRLGRDAYTYLHIPIVAGIIVAAVGLQLVVAHPSVALEGRELAVLPTGAALYLAGHLAFRLRMIGTLAPKRIVAIAALGASIVITSGAPSLLSLAVVVAVLALLSAAETIGRLRRVRPSPRTPEIGTGGPAAFSRSSAMALRTARPDQRGFTANPTSSSMDQLDSRRRN